jgi:hypothetical protein
MNVEHERHAHIMADEMYLQFMENTLDYVRDFTVTKDGFDDLEEAQKVEKYAITLFAIQLLKEIHSYE